ncbi:hypothetical protein B0H66DRAFT_605005 [Apodospora peruviana]|uniref:Uncharacterized protein n=1 Tax=Apodospora peruviana TaxID=516989 RepID=A0AAE0M2J9_9PEZI|nr:hypothetical protein B0H66DRAFT_605005 [Apodospora peruviana]
MAGEPSIRTSSTIHTRAMRLATEANLDAITRVVCVGVADDRGYDYIFPHHHEFPDNHWKWTRGLYKEYLDLPEKFALLVVAATGNGFVNEPVAVGAWDLALETEPAGAINPPLSSTLIDERSGGNEERLRAFENAQDRIWANNFTKYGNTQLHH